MSFENLNVDQFEQKMNDPDTIVLDVRAPEELSEGQIPGHKMINIKSPDFRDKIDELDRSKTYLVYCRSGVRSVNACNVMIDLGFDHLYNLVGGVNAWNSAKKA